MSRSILLLFVQLIGVSLASNVVELNADTFDSQVTRSKYLWIVEFYSPTCPYCMEFAPEYEKTAESLQGSGEIRVGKVDATRYAELGSRYNIKGYPTVKFFHPDRTEPSDYSGPRFAINLLTTAKSYVDRKKVEKRNTGSFGNAAKMDRVVKLR